MKIESLASIHQTAKEFIAAMGEKKVFLFYGSMGAGKTTFIRAICEELGVKESINSPTFAIINEYKSGVGEPIFHFDFYRINKEEEAFDFGYEENIQVEYSSPLDLYVFVGDLPSVTASFSSLVGRNPLPPYWALGAQQSRWSYNSFSEVDEVIQGYLDADIPLSTVYLDIDYMDSYKDFSVNESKFPNIKNWLAEKSKQGIHIVPIIDAGVKAEEGYDIYDEGMANGYFSTLDGQVYHNEVWPGDSVFPAFLDENVRKWWASHIATFLELGFSGIWNDMNEPASFNGPLPLEVNMGNGVEHSLAHNVYGHYMVKAGYEGFILAKKRPFQLTRAGFAGTSSFANTWAGDNQSIYDHLRLSLPQMMNMSLSGQTYIGVDIGGFSGNTTKELLVRFASAALLYPLYRNHSALGSLNQEPYRLDGEYLEAYRKAVKLRYELLPTLYDELYFGYAYGSSPLRPLIYNYPEDQRLINENTEIMLGENILLAPSLFPGQSKRSVYLPDEFIHYPSFKRFSKGDHVIDVGIGDIPLFIRAHSLVVLAPQGQGANRSEILRLFTACDEASVLHYEDAGDGLGYLDGEYNLYRIVYKDQKASLEYLHHGYPSHYKKFVVETPHGFIYESAL